MKTMRTVIQSTTSALALAFACASLPGCLFDDAAEDTAFHTSGSREADQRANQRISMDQQLRGEEDGESPSDRGRPTLYDRLGGETGVRTIVSDFVDRVIADPRANWKRTGVRSGGLFGIGTRSVEWQPTEESLAKLKQHLAEFIGVATGGPAEYTGRGMVDVHGRMKITNAEFDASIGDLKASLDALQVPDNEQKELLAVFESARPQVAEKR